MTKFSALDADFKVILKRILVKAADISNQGRPHHLCVVWSERIAVEYFAQVLAKLRGVLYIHGLNGGNGTLSHDDS